MTREDTEPLVSVIIPAYNCEDVLERAIDSVLNQTVLNLELIIVDDHSEDNTIDLIKRYSDNRIRYIRHDKNKGGSAARNTGINQSSGRYVAFLDSDDEWMETKLEKQINAIRTNSNFGAVYCDFRNMKEGTFGRIFNKVSRFRKKSPKERPSGGKELIPDIVLLEGFKTGGMSTILVEREIINRINGFDESFDRHQDWEFRIRLLENTKMLYIKEILVNKYDYGAPPPADNVKKSKKLFLDKFEEYVKFLEDQGFNPKKNHNVQLAKLYIREGKFNQGISVLEKTSGSIKKYSVFLSIQTIFGIYNIINRSRNHGKPT